MSRNALFELPLDKNSVFAYVNLGSRKVEGQDCDV
jgi:hypothetical protein